MHIRYIEKIKFSNSDNIVAKLLWMFTKTKNQCCSVLLRILESDWCINTHIHFKGKNDKKAKHFLLDDIIINNDEGIVVLTHPYGM